MKMKSPQEWKLKAAHGMTALWIIESISFHCQTVIAYLRA